VTFKKPLAFPQIMVYILIYIKNRRNNMPDIAKVFKSGRSQAVRLPKEYRFNASEVYITKEKGKIILSEKPYKTWAEIFKDFKGDPDFSINRSSLNDKPRKVNL
jgi:antitoxin VapB